MWADNVSKEILPSHDQLCEADGKIEELQLQQNKMQYDADALSLARDAAQLAKLYQQEKKCERSERLQKVTHLKQENQIGSGLVMQHMNKYCRHLAGPVSDMTDEIVQASG